MNKKKIINDPVYGFINIPYEILFDLIEHTYVQRLRRISQTGMTHLIYPGAHHTRFHHVLGAMHLMQEAVNVLKSKGIEITEDEAKAVLIAILLHDIGHGPFSHALEHELSSLHHEDWSMIFMEELNKQFNGQLTTAISIFKNEYPKKFLYQLISGQLDMDRLDYLNRDSFFTGVTEGKIGYDRIIKMLNVADDHLVVEIKGLYSIEKFIIARSLMYWQVYLHKTTISAEKMLIHFIRILKANPDLPEIAHFSPALRYFLTTPSENQERTEAFKNFVRLDDTDVYHALKWMAGSEHADLKIIATGLINRKLFRCQLSKDTIAFDKNELANKIADKYTISAELAQTLIWDGRITTATYSGLKNEILFLLKDGSTKPLSEVSDHDIKAKTNHKNYLCYPKI